MDAKLKLPFQAVAIRYVHDARVGEFLNVGVVLLCAEGRFAGARFLQQWGRVSTTFPGADLVLLRRIARAFEARCDEWGAGANGQQSLQPIRELGALLDTVMRFDDSSLQVSPFITGVTADAQRTMAELFALYVGAGLGREERASRGDGDVWRDFAVNRLQAPQLVARLQRRVVEAPHYQLAFDHAWKNGAWNVAQPVSLDLVEPRTIREKATSWAGKLLTLRPSVRETSVFLLVGMPPAGSSAPVQEAAHDAVAILERTLAGEAQIVSEENADTLAAKIADDLAAHAGEA